MEYGRPRRHYIERAELCLRVDLGLPPALRLLLLSRELVHQLEVAAYEFYAHSRSDRDDSSLPDEMRWLTYYPRVRLRSVDMDLERRFGMVASSPEAGQRWLNGSLGERLVRLSSSGSWAGLPLVLMTQHGRLGLITEMPEISLVQLDDTLDLFELAVERADEELAGWSEDEDGAWLSTAAFAWQCGDLPADPPSPSPHP